MIFLCIFLQYIFPFWTISLLFGRNSVLNSCIQLTLCADYPLLNSSACLLSHGQDDRRLLMACPAGHLVKLVRLIYGHSESTSRCHLLPGDCVTHLVARGNEVTCVGLNRCDVRVTSRDHRRPIPGCQLPTNYIHTSFQCIPGMGTTARQLLRLPTVAFGVAILNINTKPWVP